MCPLPPVQVDAGKIPVAHDNSSRGKWPLWQYINAGVNTMHVNVPNMADIIGALLRAPFAALRAYLRCKDLPEELARFYEDGISDSCFNGKWKALEEFNAGLDKQAIPPPTHSYALQPSITFNPLRPCSTIPIPYPPLRHPLRPTVPIPVQPHNATSYKSLPLGSPTAPRAGNLAWTSLLDTVYPNLSMGSQFFFNAKA